MNQDDSGNSNVARTGDTSVAAAQWKIEHDTQLPILLTAGLTRRRLLAITCTGGTSHDRPAHPIYVGGDDQVSSATGYVLYGWDRILLSVDGDTDVHVTADLSAGEFTYVSILEIQ